MKGFRLVGYLAALCIALATGSVAAAPRVVVLAPNLAELVCAAGACADLVGAVSYANHPPQAAGLPRVGDAFRIDAEKVLALRPDWVLAWGGGTPARDVARLRELGLRVRVVTIRRLDGIGRAMLQIGKLLGTEKVAQRAAGDFHRRLVALRTRYGGRRRLRVLYEIGVQPIYTVNRDSPISQALRLCGADNVFADLPKIAAPVSVESVLDRNPDVIVFGREDAAAARAYWHRFPQIPAVRRGSLYAVDADTLAGAAPRMLDAVAQLCRTLDRARPGSSVR